MILKKYRPKIVIRITAQLLFWLTLLMLFVPFYCYNDLGITSLLQLLLLFPVWLFFIREFFRYAFVTYTLTNDNIYVSMLSMNLMTICIEDIRDVKIVTTFSILMLRYIFDEPMECITIILSNTKKHRFIILDRKQNIEVYKFLKSHKFDRFWNIRRILKKNGIPWTLTVIGTSFSAWYYQFREIVWIIARE